MQTFVSENFRPPSSVNEIGNPTGRTESSAPTMQRQLRLAEYSGNEQKRNCVSPSITACSTFICTESYRKSIRLASDRAFRPRSGQKFARVSAQYGASPAHLFAYFFWRNRKSRSAKQQLQCQCKRGSSGESGQSGRQRRPPLQCAVQNCLRSNSCALRQKRQFR